jgi:DNA-binding NarL/FixJ family response regulator
MITHVLPPTSQDHRLVRVLLVDDNPQVLHELHLLLELSGDIQIVGEAGNGLDSVRLVSELSPDVVVMDLEMPGMDGYEATRQIKAHQPAPRVVILSVHATLAEMEQALSVGADSFVLKGARYETLLNAILGQDGAQNPFDSKKGI